MPTVARYHFLTWFLTMLVVMVFMHQVGMGWLQRRYPVLAERIAAIPCRFGLHPASRGCRRVSA